MKRKVWVATLLCISSLACATNRDSGFAAYFTGDYVNAFKKLKPLAEEGDAAAQCLIAHMYRGGVGVSQDFPQAFNWYQKSAEQNWPEAQDGLGMMYESGQGVPKDYVNAVMWFRRAAESGDHIAQYDLGRMYESGRGVSKDYARAVVWYRKAAETPAANADAQNALGGMYANGWGVDQNFSLAAYWFAKAAKQGYEDAIRNLEVTRGKLMELRIKNNTTLVRDDHDPVFRPDEPLAKGKTVYRLSTWDDKYEVLVPETYVVGFIPISSAGEVRR